jgi:hypothetical protein
MSLTVCLVANSLSYPNGGGYRWIYLNWALGLRAIGCRVIWMEGVGAGVPAARVQSQLAHLRTHLQPYGLAENVALCSWSEGPLSPAARDGCIGADDAASEADLLINMQYSTLPRVVQQFRRKALIDIDPGLLQVWMAAGQLPIAAHDAYFTIGETIGEPEGRCPDAGVRWQRAAPCVALEWWPRQAPSVDGAFSTVAHWSGGWTEFEGELYPDDKRTAFQDYLDLPRHVSENLELALSLGDSEDDERRTLQERGWTVRNSYEVSSTPWDFQHYVQRSRGEFSCAKPSYVRMQTAWVSDRTVCYLASGKPAIVQHTGRSGFLPDADGLFRFRSLAEATRSLETVAADYAHQCRRARALAEEYFDARKVVGSVVERSLA